MHADNLIARASTAFAGQQPRRINECNCPECHDFSRLLAGREPDDIPSAELGDGIILLGPATLAYFVPGIVRFCLSNDPDEGDICNTFVFSILAQPISKRSSPECHPKLGELTVAQTSVILEILQHVTRSWYNDGEELPREISRATANWSWFLERARICDRP
ncbi:hypothetical protein Q31a_41790 [Aureliella helgolandensis]|uniref:Uncharacterized protein n=1 Tax=Aureliella helgolandensis TaxID=2527968 RepID=A0A518GB59_9BACT|nr:hypothetical protein Q31a_41790 [Aureliella helgolandensis]